MENIEQIYTSCLAQGAYFIESDGEAAVIDPLRESFPYIERAKEKNVKIKYIFETHFHADFVSGHIDLADKTGAQIIYGPKAETDFDKYNAVDGEIFEIGKIKIKVLHTPGHTPESTTYLLIDEKGEEKAIFTGDTLFIGDVGRPDLAQKTMNLSQEELAGWLYDSLRNKIMPLSDDIIIYPAHGAGSSCGKNMSKETYDTLGNQKKVNYALNAKLSKEDFIKEVTDGLMMPPQYFSKNAMLNKKGYQTIDEVMRTGLDPLSPEQFEVLSKQEDVLILDVRDKWDFVHEHIKGSLFIGLGGSFAPWVGTLIEDIDQKIILITPSGKEEETVRRLARVGYDNSIGYLDGGLQTWKKSGRTTESLPTIKVEDFVDSDIQDEIIDVRKPDEYNSAHIVGAHSITLDFFLTDNYKELDKSKSYYVHCRSGYRSTAASSFLRREGFSNLTNIIGSFDKIKSSHLNVIGACPSLTQS